MVTLSHPYLEGNYAPIATELDATLLRSIGAVPRDLAGMFVRNGADPRFAGAGHTAAARDACDDPATLASRMRADVQALLGRCPTMNVGVVQDGAPEMWILPPALPAPPQQGGCAGCRMGGEGQGSAAGLGLLVAAALARRRRG